MWLNRIRQTGLISDGLGALAVCAFAIVMSPPAHAQLFANAASRSGSNSGSSSALQKKSMGNDASATDLQVPLAEQALLGAPDDADDYLDRLGGPIDASLQQSSARSLQPPTPTEALIADTDDDTTKSGTGDASESSKRPSAQRRQSIASSVYGRSTGRRFTRRPGKPLVQQRGLLATHKEGNAGHKQTPGQPAGRTKQLASG
jgi:hypothetical protein